MSDCAYFEQLCSNSIDGTLTDDEHRVLQAHLDECPSCAALLHDLEQMCGLLAQPIDLPEGLHERIMEGVVGQARLSVVQPEKPARHMPVFTMVAAAAVVVMVVLSGGVPSLFGTTGGGAPSTVSAESGSAAGEAANEAILQAAGHASESEQVVPHEAEPRAAVTEEQPPAAAAPEAGTAIVPADTDEMPAAPAPQDTGEVYITGGTPAAFEAGEGKQITARATIALPESIGGMSVAHCYLATGSAELPVIDGTLIETADGYSYFSVKNNMTVLQQTIDSLEKAAYTVVAYEDVELHTDAKAEAWLLIVRKE